MKKPLWMAMAALSLLACTEPQPVTVTVTNSLPAARSGEMVELSMEEISARLCLPDTSRLLITDEHGAEVPWQITYDDLLIFPVAVPGEGSATYTIAVGTPSDVEVVACGRVYPERLDDLAWENDRAAYRTYGPALQARGERAYGYDVWTKSVAEPVVENRYDGELNHHVSYHVDHGNGMDVYAVGPTLGGGTAALFPDSVLVYPYCYSECEVLDNGPLRFTARLTYLPATVKNDSAVVETRFIQLDKGSYLNKTTVSFSGLTEAMPLAAGIVIHREHPDGYAFDASDGYIAYADSTQNAHAGNGVIYIGGAFPEALTGAGVQLFSEAERAGRGGALGHVLAVADYVPDTEYVYYWGSGWSKGGVGSEADWIDYLKNFARQVRCPLSVAID